jgi:L-rhamnose mutarotase
MSSFGFTIRLKDEAAVETYKQYHREAWPEVAGPGGALEKIGVRRMCIFFITPLTLFMYVDAVDGFDPVADFGRALDLDPRVRQWDDIMHSNLLTRIPDNEGPLNWAIMEAVFDYSSKV